MMLRVSWSTTAGYLRQSTNTKIRETALSNHLHRGQILQQTQLWHPYRNLSSFIGTGQVGIRLRSSPTVQHRFYSSNRESRAIHASARKTLWFGIFVVSVFALGFSISARDPIWTEAGKAKSKEKKRLIRLKDIKQHGADSHDGIWVSRGVS